MSSKPNVWDHLEAAAMLFLGLVVSLFFISGLVGLWQTGIGPFLGVIGAIIVFSWLTHEIAKTVKRNFP